MSTTAIPPPISSSEDRNLLIGSCWQDTASKVSYVLQFIEDVYMTISTNQQHDFFTEHGKFGQALVLRMVREAVEFDGYSVPQGNEPSRAGA